MTDTCQIGELAARSGLSPDTLRYYERVGLLPTPRRTGGGFRVYPAQTLDRLRFIKQAQAMGLTLHEIRDLVSYQDQGGLKRCRQVHDFLRAKLKELEGKIGELVEFRRILLSRLEQCEQTLGGERGAQRTEPECPVIETLNTKQR